MIHGDQDNILQHNDEVNTRAQDVSVQMPQIVVQGDTAKILQWGYSLMEYRVSRAR